MIVNWLSWPTGVGLAVHWLVDLLFDVSYTGFIAVTRALGAIVLVVFAYRQWMASRDGHPDALRRAGLVLLAAAVLSPATLPWYFSWCLALLAMVAWTPAALAVAAFGSVWLIMVAYPSGEFAVYNWGYIALAAAGSLLAAVSLLRPDPLGLRTRPPPRRYAMLAPRVQ
jgi:alpha-1,6-mannosyltransferase